MSEEVKTNKVSIDDSLKKWRLKARNFRLKARNYFKYKLKRRISGSIVALAIGTILTLLFAFLPGSLASTRLPIEGSTLLFTVGAAMIGVLAILFTLNTLLINNSLDKLPGGLYRLFVKDPALDLIFAGIAFGGLALFVLGLSFQNESGSYRYFFYRIALIIATWVIVFIYLFYKRVQHVLSPTYQLLHFTKQIKQDIDEISYLANEYAELAA